jgi:uncharacterized phage-associated protein
LVTESAFEDGDNVLITFSPSSNGNLSQFNESEQQIIEKIIAKFSNTSTSAIVRLSHEEKAWKDLYQAKATIDYMLYAFHV